MMCGIYARFYKFGPHRHLFALAQEFEKDFPSLNFFIERTVDYNPKGRYQDLSEAHDVDKLIRSMMDEYIDYQTVSVDEFDKIITTIEDAIKD
jgi:hypothetical protein